MPQIEHDPDGGIRIRKPDRKVAKIDRVEHEAHCRTRLPALGDDAWRGNHTTVTQEQAAANRRLLCYAPPCCGTVYRPKGIVAYGGWYWVKVSRLRLFWWRLRGHL